MLDIPGRRIIKTIPVGGEPHFIITGPYAPPGVPTPRHTATSSLNITLLVSTIVLTIAALVVIFWLIWKQRKRRSRRHSEPAELSIDK